MEKKQGEASYQELSARVGQEPGTEPETDIKEDMLQSLFALALEARNRSYVPYSHFAVGAALLTADGKVFQGCNIENASFSPTNCAERTAIFKAVSDGFREFAAIAVAGGNEGSMPEDFCPPCGVCLQVMSEFCTPEFPVYLVKSEQEVKRYRLGELLPVKFDNLK